MDVYRWGWACKLKLLSLVVWDHGGALKYSYGVPSESGG